jgi:hypothetical protein
MLQGAGIGVDVFQGDPAPAHETFERRVEITGIRMGILLRPLGKFEELERE